MTKPVPSEGQFFTINPVQPPKPKASISWGLPIALGLLTIPLLMFGFGFAQQQQPAPNPSPSPTATPSVAAVTAPSLASQQDATTQPLVAPSPVVTPLPFSPQPTDTATLPIARIHSFNKAANFRTAPSLHSQVLGVLMHGDLVELVADRRVSQDGVIWVPVRFRGQSGWMAQNFIGGQTNAGI